MKRYLLLLVFGVFIYGTSHAQSITTDDFDSYNTGLFDGQFNPVSWTGWFGNTSNANITTEQAFSGTQSMKVWDDTGKESDIVALLGTMSTGVDSISFMQYVSSTGSGAYYNLQHNYTNTAGDWAAEVYFGTSPAAAFVQTDGLQYNFTPTLDAWVEQKFVFDFTNSQGQFYYGGVLTHTWVLNTNASGGTGLNTINAINFYAHDNGAGSNSLAYYDDVSVLAPPSVDVELSSVAPPAVYSQLTADHTVPLTLSADVTNVGGQGVTNVAVTFDVVDATGTNVFTETVTQATLASAASSTFAATGTFVPSALGSYSINYNVTMTETDTDLSNNNDTFMNIVTITDSTLAKDNNTAVGSIGVSGAGPGQMGHIYEFQANDSISSVTVVTGQTNAGAIGEQLIAHVYSTLSGVPTGTPLASSAPITVDTSSNLQELLFTFSSPVPVDSGMQYFVAIEEGLNTAALAYSFDIFTPNTGFFTTDAGATWTTFVSVNFPITVFVRPNVTGTMPAVSTNQVKPYEGVFEINPNPTTGFATLNVEMDDAQDINIAVFDMTGKLVQAFNDASVTNRKYTIDLSHQPNGVYLVRMMTNGQMVTKRVVLNK